VSPIQNSSNGSLLACSTGPADTSFYYPDETEESTEAYKSMSIGNRLTKVSDVVPVLAFLCTEEAGWVTGQTIRINGGLAD
jgi:3-oxoacyl-[acyl-carrier protein] reductase